MRILIAEDERMSRRLLENTLRGWGHDVVSATDGLEAWNALRDADAPHLAILDWMMPGLDGLKLCRLARETPATRSHYIILLTARADKKDLIQGLVAGANDYLTKPFDRAELQARVQTAARMIEMQNAMSAELAERKRAEEVLRVSEERFRSLIENSSDAIALFNVDGDILYASPSTPQILGFTPEEFVRLNAMEIIHSADRKLVREHLRMALERPRIGVAAQARVRHKDGRWRWMEGTFTNLLEEPSVGAVVNNYRDITERKEAEDALAESEEQLRLSQRLEAVGRLAGGIAHDFNNLLTVINGYGELLLTKLEDEESRDKVQEIRTAGERAAGLTRQLLAFSRKQVLQPKVLDLNSIVTNLAKMLQRLIGEDIELVLSLNAALGQIKADPGQLEQVLLNLVVNARDAMPNGGKMVVTTANAGWTGEVATEHKAGEAGSFVMLAVSDCGHGMDAETQKHIFEPFFTTKGLGKGTGLGLSTAYGIVKQSGGNIWVYSEPGHGTTFKIYLPRIDEPIETTEIDAAELESLTGTETILLVEDEAMVRKITRQTLEIYGYRVIEASDGQEALNISGAFSEGIDLLLTDVVMPGISGRALADKLASARPQTKVLFMSGYTDDAIVHHGVLDEGTMFLEKPFSPDALAKKVSEVLNHIVLGSARTTPIRF